MIVTLINIGFLRITFADVLDILMVAAVIYVVFKWIKGSAAINIFLAIISLLLLRMLVNALNMKMMSALLGTIIDVGTIALVVIFQPEIRHFLFNLGRKVFRGRDTLWKKFLKQDKKELSATSIDGHVTVSRRYLSARLAPVCRLRLQGIINAPLRLPALDFLPQPLVLTGSTTVSSDFLVKY